MAARARKVTIIADGSKLGGHAFARICPIERVHTLITDTTVPAERTADLSAAGIKVIRA